MKRNWTIWFLIACLALFACRALLYAAVLPPNRMPDELIHFKHIRLAQYQPEIESGQMTIGGLMQWINADHLLVIHRLDKRPALEKMNSSPPQAVPKLAFYPLMGWTMRALDIQGNMEAWYLCRAISILFGLAVMICLFATLRLLVPARPLLAVAGTAFLALLPQYAALCAAISTDRPAELAGALFFLFMVQIARPERAGRIWPWLGAVVILFSLPWIKRTAFYFVAVAALAGLPWWRTWLARQPHRRFIAAGLTSLALAGFLMVVFWPPAARLAAGMLGMPLLRIYSPFHPADLFQQQGMLNAIIQGIRPWDPGFWHFLWLNLLGLFKSSWATFGYLDVHLDQGWYLGAALLSLAALLGWGRLLFRPGPDWRLSPWQGRALGLLAAGGFLALAVVLFRQVAFLPGSIGQGRYAFPGLTALITLGAIGYLCLWPRNWQRPALAGALLFMAAMDLASIWQAIVPRYYNLVF